MLTMVVAYEFVSSIKFDLSRIIKSQRVFFVYKISHSSLIFYMLQGYLEILAYSIEWSVCTVTMDRAHVISSPNVSSVISGIYTHCGLIWSIFHCKIIWWEICGNMVIVGANFWSRKLSSNSIYYASMSHHLFPISFH